MEIMKYNKIHICRENLLISICKECKHCRQVIKPQRCMVWHVLVHHKIETLTREENWLATDRRQ